MSIRTLVSLAASVLITAGTIAALASVGPQPHTAPAITINGLSVTNLPGVTVHPPASTIDGLPVTNLPGITVHPANTAATAPAADTGTLAVIDGGNPFDLLIKDAAAQVTSSHLGMPYYSFGSGIGQISKD